MRQLLMFIDVLPGVAIHVYLIVALDGEIFKAPLEADCSIPIPRDTLTPGLGA